MTLARSASARAARWDNAATTFGQLAEILSKYVTGGEDVRAILSGEVAGNSRIAPDMVANLILMLDIDAGAACAEILTRLWARTLAAIVWAMHPHGRTRSTINAKGLETFQKQRGQELPFEDSELCPLCVDSLL